MSAGAIGTGTSPGSRRRGLLARFDNLGMTWKLLLPVLVAVGCLIGVSATALIGFGSLNSGAQHLDADGRPRRAVGGRPDPGQPEPGQRDVRLPRLSSGPGLSRQPSE